MCLSLSLPLANLLKSLPHHLKYLSAHIFLIIGVSALSTAIPVNQAVALDKLDADVPETRTVIRDQTPVPRFVSLNRNCEYVLAQAMNPCTGLKKKISSLKVISELSLRSC